jgi:hypothetical protein
MSADPPLLEFPYQTHLTIPDIVGQIPTIDQLSSRFTKMLGERFNLLASFDLTLFFVVPLASRAGYPYAADDWLRFAERELGRMFGQCLRLGAHEPVAMDGDDPRPVAVLVAFASRLRFAEQMSNIVRFIESMTEFVGEDALRVAVNATGSELGWLRRA